MDLSRGLGDVYKRQVVEVLLGVTVCDAVTLGVGDGHGEPKH
jgi:hypothetical protein